MYLIKTVALIYLLATPVSALAAASGSSPKGKPFVEINGQIAEVKGQIATLDQRMNNLLSRVSLNESRLDGVNDAIAWLQKHNAELVQLMSELDSGLSSVEEVVAAIEAESAIFQAELDSYGEALDELESEIALNQEVIDVLNLSLVEGLRVIQERLDDNEVMLSELFFIADEFQEQLALKQNMISGTCAENERLTSIEEDGALICETAEASPLTGLRVAQVTKIVEIDTSTWNTQPNRWYDHSLSCQNRVGGQFEVPSSLEVPKFNFIKNPKITFSGDAMNVKVYYRDYDARYRKYRTYYVKLTVSCLVLDGEQGVLIRTD